MVKRNLILMASLLAACGCGVVSAADTNMQGTYTLKQVIVTAERMPTPDLTTPASTSVITEQDIQNKGYQTVGEALDQTIGINTNSYAAGGEDFGGMSGRANIRGLDQGTVVLVNGAPTNLFNYASTDGIPIDAVKKIEVIRGSNSVLYGAEAMGGVINIITKTGGTPKTTLKYTYGNYNSEYQVGNQGKNYTVFFGRHYYDKQFDAQKVFQHTQASRSKGKGYKDNIFASVNLTDKLTFNWARVETQRDGFYRAVVNGHKYNRYASDPYYTYPGKSTYKTIKNNVNLIYNDDSSHFRSILAYNNKRLDSTNKYYDASENVVFREHGASQAYNAYNINFDNQKTWFFNDKKDSLTAGLDYKYEHYKQLFDADPYWGMFTMNRNNKNHKINRKSYGIFASYSHAFNDRLTGIFGAREHINQSNGYDKRETKFLPQVQFNYKLNKQWSLYTNVAESYDLPSIDSKFYAPNTVNRVKPQQGWTYEFGSKYISGKDSLKMDVFYMDIKDRFRWVATDTTYNNFMQINDGKFHNLGFEMEYNHKVNDHWSFNAGTSISNPKSKSTNGGDWVQTDPRVQVNAGVEYTENKFFAGLNYFLTTDRENALYSRLGDYGGYDHRIPDRNILNAVFRYEPNKDQSISFNMYNMLNRHNPTDSAEDYDLPFNWTVSYSLSF